MCLLEWLYRSVKFRKGKTRPRFSFDAGGPTPTPPPPPRTTSSGGGGGGGDGGGGSSGTGGIVFIVLLLALLAVYFVGFGLFYRYRQNKSGAELIAHRTFWGSLPGLAKDGVVFVFQGIRSKCGGGYGSV